MGIIRILTIVFLTNFLFTDLVAKPVREINFKKSEVALVSADYIHSESFIYTNFWPKRELLLFIDDILKSGEANRGFISMLLADFSQPINFILADSSLTDIAVSSSVIAEISKPKFRFSVGLKGIYEIYLDKKYLRKDKVLSLGMRFYNNGYKCIEKKIEEMNPQTYQYRYIKIGQVELEQGPVKITARVENSLDKKFNLLIVDQLFREKTQALINDRVNSLGAKVVYILAKQEKLEFVVP